MSASNDYTVASFNAAKEASLKYLDSAIKEIVNNAKAKVDVYEAEMLYYDGVVAQNGQDFSPLFADLAAIDIQLRNHMATFSSTFSPQQLTAFTTELARLKSLRAALQAQISQAATASKTVYTTVSNSVYTRKYAASNDIRAAETENKNIRKEEDKQTATEYAIAANAAWNIYYVATINANARYLLAHQKTEKTYADAKKNADAAFEETVIPAAVTYVERQLTYREQFEQAVNENNQSVMVQIRDTVNGRDTREWYASLVRSVGAWTTRQLENHASRTSFNNPYVVGSASFVGNFAQNVSELGLGLITFESSIDHAMALLTIDFFRNTRAYRVL